VLRLVAKHPSVFSFFEASIASLVFSKFRCASHAAHVLLRDRPSEHGASGGTCGSHEQLIECQDGNDYFVSYAK
jgi:hypothetical protein